MGLWSKTNKTTHCRFSKIFKNEKNKCLNFQNLYTLVDLQRRLRLEPDPDATGSEVSRSRVHGIGSLLSLKLLLELTEFSSSDKSSASSNFLTASLTLPTTEGLCSSLAVTNEAYNKKKRLCKDILLEVFFFSLHIQKHYGSKGSTAKKKFWKENSFFLIEWNILFLVIILWVSLTFTFAYSFYTKDKAILRN